MIARWMIIGFVLWAAVTVAFRFIAQEAVPWLLIALPFAMFAFTYVLLHVVKIAPEDRAEVASIFAVPGLLVGIYEINSFSVVFPNFDPSQYKEFAGLMFATYAATIMAGVISSRLQEKETA